MRIAVMKFGGTSVATEEARAKVLDHVRRALGRGLSPVVVVSAMGRAPAPYATDSLLALVQPFSQVQSAAELDQLMACGEIISCTVLSHALRAAGVASRSFDGRQAGILCSEEPGEAHILDIDPEPLLAYLNSGGVPVVAGFQGANAGGDLVTLGRGGSDTSAVALGAALRAHYVEIYTDVEGVMTADPRVYDQARILREVNFEEMGELASEGAKVVHPRAIGLGDLHGVPLWIKNTLQSGYGTFLARAVPRQAYEQDRIVTGIAHVFGRVGITMEVADRGRQVQLLQAFAERDINLDLITLTQSRLHAVVTAEAYECQAKALLEELGVDYRSVVDCAKLSVVGAGMRGTPGVVAQLLSCLHEAGVEVLHSTDSNITISLLIREAQVPEAVAALHRRFVPPAEND